MTMSHLEWPWFVAEFLIEERANMRRSLAVHSYLIAVTSADSAYEKALALGSTLGDAVRDSDGNVVEYICLGLHDLDTLQVEKVEDGVHLSVLEWTIEPPSTRQRNELTLFRV